MRYKDLYEATNKFINKEYDPALMTFKEYYKIVNPDDKFHPSHAYNQDLESMNSIYKDGSEYLKTKLYKRIITNGLKFEIRTFDDSRYGITIYVFDEDKQIVGYAVDEWGAVLITVAKEYRNFGFGTLLGNLYRTYYPNKSSGGFTDAGYHNFFRVYQSFVREYLKTGIYSELVRTNKIDIKRVNEIITSAKLEPLKPKIQKDYKHNRIDDILIYTDTNSGQYIIYNKKIKQLFDDDTDDIFVKKMVKGVIYAPSYDNKFTRVKRFYAETQKIGEMLLYFIANDSKIYNTELIIEPSEYQYVNNIDTKFISDESNIRGYKSRSIECIKPSIDLQYLGEKERLFRKSFDIYNEFMNQLNEYADSIS